MTICYKSLCAEMLAELIELQVCCGDKFNDTYFDRLGNVIDRCEKALNEPESEQTLLESITSRLHTQNNRATRDPIFQARGLRRIYGLCPEFADGTVWIDTEEGIVEVDPPNNNESLGQNIVKVGYTEVWEVLMVAFTEEGIKEHLKLNGHNYRIYEEVQIYTDSLWRCPEMLAIRQMLLSMSQASYEAEKPETPVIMS